MKRNIPSLRIIHAKSEGDASKGLEYVQKCNRDTLQSVDNWINREDWNSPPSLFHYGLPNHVYHLINVDVSNELTEVDLICYFITFLHEPICYLEIGVSVGKTFYQIIEFISKNMEKYSINGLDIEQINPILNNLIIKKSDTFSEESVESSNLHNDIHKEKNTITKWLLGNEKDITYYEANEFDETIWQSMNKKYNVLFSDALHEPHALIQEYNQLKKNNLIDFTQFIYCFDDLENHNSGPMWQSVLQIYEDLKTLTHTPLYIHHYVVNGWLGNNEYPHNFGIITNVEFPTLETSGTEGSRNGV